MHIDYRINDLTAYINWKYFFHAWAISGQSEEGFRLREDAQAMLTQMEPYLLARTVVEILPAYSEGDDIVVHKETACQCGQRHATGAYIRIPMLRQQTPDSKGHCLCLSDFIRPQSSAQQDKIGIFATSVATHAAKRFIHDDYNSILLQTLADRLAEAAAERLHLEVRKKIWGYAPHEELTIEELHQEKFQGIRPAIGYPCLPDISLNRSIDDILDLRSIGVTLTSSAMMAPHASVSGFMISLPQARYFSIGEIGRDQAQDYARRRNMSYEEIKKYIQCC